MVDVYRRLSVQGRSEGLDKVAADLRAVAGAQKQVASASQATATVTEVSSRKTLSAAAAYDRLRRTLDPVYQAQQKLAAAERVLSQAFDQGLVSLSRRNELLAVAAQRNVALGTTSLIDPTFARLGEQAIANTSLLSGMGSAGATAMAKLEQSASTVDPVFVRIGQSATANARLLQGMGDAGEAAMAKLTQSAIAVDPLFARIGSSAIANAKLLEGMGAAGAAAVRRVADAQNSSALMVAGMGAIGGPRVADLAANQRLIAGMSGAMDRFGKSAGQANFQTKQLSFQLFDIAQGVPLAFQSPIYGLMNLATQTGQVSQLYMGQGGLKQAFADTMGVAKSLGAALLTSLFTPLGQVAVISGLVATAVAAIFMNENRHAKRAEEALKDHVDLIERIKDAYKEAGDAASFYGGESLRVLKLLDEEALRQVKEQLNRQAAELIIPGSGGQGVLAEAAIGKHARDLVVEFNKAGRDGTADWRKFGDALVTAFNDPDITDGQREILRGMIAIAAERARLERKIRPPPSMRQIEDKSMKDNLTLILEQRAAMERIRRGLEADIIAIGARSPGEIGSAVRGQGQANRTDFSTVETLQLEADAALAAAQAEFQLTEARRQREQTARDGLESAQLDVDLVGKGIAQSIELRTNWQLYADLRREAEDNNVAFDEAQFQRLKAINAEMAKLAENAALTQLRSDISFDRSQMFRSPIDQEVADQLREIYGDDFLSHMRDFEAQQIRINERLAELDDIGRDLTRGSFHDFFDGIREGQGVFDSFATAGVNALTKIQSKLIDMIADQAWNSLFSRLAGGLFGGGMNLGGARAPVGVSVFHTGGIAGSASQMRYVHPAYFDDAPRMHDGGIAGLRSNEVPAILERGERVIPRMQAPGSTVKLGDMRIHVDLTGANGDTAIASAAHAAALKGASMALGKMVAHLKEQQRAYA